MHQNSGKSPVRAYRPGAPPYVRNAWYVLAFADEVKAGQTLRRHCMDQPIMLFRAEDGAVAAIHDRCPHRAVPLSMGTVIGSEIQCAYHGMRFDGRGRCTHIPTQEQIPAAAHIRHYPTCERMNFIWVWMGDLDHADLAIIPDYADVFCDASETWQHSSYFMMPIAGNYGLLFENLLDTSHISFLHIGGIDDGKVATSPFTVAASGDQVELDRWMDRDEAGPGPAKLFSIPVGTAYSRRLKTRSTLPNIHVIRNEIGFPDQPDAKPKLRINIMPITPATAKSLYQFVAISTNYPVDVTEDLVHQLWTVFRQDAEVLEAVQLEYDQADHDVTEVSLKADAAALTARRILSRLAQS